MRRVTTDTGGIAALLTQAVPWVSSTGITFGEVTAERAVVHLPDVATGRNHVGGPHAALIFGLGETASGAVGLAAFGATADRATPLVVRSDIEYVRLAKGPLTAVAELRRDRDEVLAELDAGQRPEFAVVVTVRDAQERETTRMTVVWTLRPHR